MRCFDRVVACERRFLIPVARFDTGWGHSAGYRRPHPPSLDEALAPGGVQLREAARAGDELGGGAVFDDAAVLHDEHAVGDRDRRQAVGDDDRRAVGEQGRAGPPARAARSGCRATPSPRPGSARPGRRGTRARTRAAAAGRPRPGRRACSRRCRSRRAAPSMNSSAPTAARGRDDLVERRVGLAERDVLGDRPAEQVRLLGDHDDRAPQVLRVQAAQVDAVERDRCRSSGRRSARAAWPASTCRRRSSRPARRSARPGCAGRTRAARPGRPCRRTRRRRSRRRRAPATGRSGCGRVGDARLLLEHARDLLQRRRGRLVGVVELAISSIGSKNRRV